MTVVACDGKFVSADGLGTVNGDSVIVRNAKKIKAQGGLVFGHAGTVDVFQPLIDWFLAGSDPTKYPPCHNAKWNFVVFFTDCAILFDEDGYRPTEPRKYPFAIGSGRDVAIGALEVGATAHRAVEAAIRRITSTGGKIRDISILRESMSYRAWARTLAKRKAAAVKSSNP